MEGRSAQAFRNKVTSLGHQKNCSINLTFNYFEGKALLQVQYISFFISCWKHNFTLQTASLLSICRVIAESFLFLSLKVYSLETQDLIKMQDKIRQRDVMPKASLFFPDMWAV